MVVVVEFFRTVSLLYLFSKGEHGMWSRTGRRARFGYCLSHNHPRSRDKAREQLIPCLPCYVISLPHIQRGMRHNCCAICHLFWGAYHVGGWILSWIGGTKLVFGCRRLDFTSCGLNSQKSMRNTYWEGEEVFMHSVAQQQIQPCVTNICDVRIYCHCQLNDRQWCGFRLSLHLFWYLKIYWVLSYRLTQFFVSFSLHTL